MISTKHNMDVKIGIKFVVCFYSIDKPSVLIFNLDFGLALDSQHQISDTSCGSYIVTVLQKLSWDASTMLSKQIRGPCKYFNAITKHVYYHTAANI